MVLTILGLVGTLLSIGFYIYKKKTATPTSQERIDEAIKAHEARRLALQVSLLKNDTAHINATTEDVLQKIHTMEVAKAALAGKPIKLPTLAFLIFASALLSGCQSPPVIIPADRQIVFLHASSPAPADGYLLPVLRMQEIQQALSDKELQLDLEAAKEVKQ